MDEAISKDTKDAFLPFSNNSHTNGFVGEMEGKEATPLDGPKTFLTEKWWAGKSFGITVGRLVLAVAILAFLAGMLSGIKFDRSRNDVIYFGNKSYGMVGLAQVPGNPGVLIPVYKDVDQIARELRPGH